MIWFEKGLPLPVSQKEIFKIRDILKKRDNIAEDRIDKEIKFFFLDLGFPEYYFSINDINNIARMIEIIHSYKILGGNIAVEEENKNRIIYVVPSVKSEILNIEKKINLLVIEAAEKGEWISVDMHKTKGKLAGHYLNVYIVEKCRKNSKISKRFLDNVAEAIAEKTDNVRNFLSSLSYLFLEQSSFTRLKRYFVMWDLVKKEYFPKVQLSVTKNKKEYRLMMGFNEFYLKQNFSFFISLFFIAGIDIKRYYIASTGPKEHTFFITFYFSKETAQEKVELIQNQIQTALILPFFKNNLHLLSQYKDVYKIFFYHNLAEFIHQFLWPESFEIREIKKVLQDYSELEYAFEEFQIKIQQELYAMKTIQESLQENSGYFSLLYEYFFERFSPAGEKIKMKNSRKKLLRKLDSETNEMTADIFRLGIQFIDSVIKTNFFLKQKSAVVYKLKSDFLDKSRFAILPYSIFYFNGLDFKGYQVRFEDIARGGVRIVHSKTKENYLKNSDDNFLEVYNLALTQEKKNKDIPEGGSKGIILPYYKVKDVKYIFYSYIDTFFDVLLPNKKIKDYEEKLDVIFLGPDEGSAELMDWASLHAKKRGYPYWRAFTTGKSEEIGGISHIQYGMTTTGVHEYVLQILKKINRSETEITKVQTGGPDGDLGSNEILISKDRTLAVIDAGGVVYDPEGLNRSVLKKLARKHLPVVFYDKKKLSSKGFVIGISEKDLKISEFPDIKTGLDLRNQFHWLVQADLLLPAGGRPRTINLGNWKQIFLKNGKLRYKYIVEGANLFITQEARLKLEEQGVILIKDSSANKGGVISSSFEVLSSLVLEDEEFEELMCEKDGMIPEFRKKYIQNILNLIRLKAQWEFELLWREHLYTKKSFSVLSDEVSQLINKISNILRNSSIINKPEIFSLFIKQVIPAVLLKKYDIQEIIDKLPSNYLRAMSAKSIASFFVYSTGIEWFESIHRKWKIPEETIIEKYLDAYLESHQLQEGVSLQIKELLKLSIKERTLQLLNIFL